MHDLTSHNEKSSSLLYAGFLTRLFKKHNVNLTNEKRNKMNEFVYMISKNTINRKMGVHYDLVHQNITYMDDETNEPSAAPPPQHHEGLTNQIIMDYMAQ